MFVKEKPKLHFQRYEFKYHIPMRLADKIVPALLNYMDFDSHVGDSKDHSYDVHSIYLDSSGLKNYHEKIEGDLFRKKLRIRSYTKNVKPNDTVFVEIKRKHNMVIIKDRISMPLSSAITLASATGHRSMFKEEDHDVIDEFMLDKSVYGMRPKVLVSYKRKPLVGRTGSNLRVTFDYDIQAARVGDLDFSRETKSIYDGMLVMEVKFNDILPYWLHEIIQKYCMEAWPYSKYCFGMEAIRPTLRQFQC
ncbi:polyphosphate polymerase domain-containing protein [Candidatus Peregrinibacteria bacterium]|jgi:SPX domain protein involved in polyphosphate accumulation|nr:polyphosphate polymerase domain-containing protein [Candidatus Peregrinibacteria bacterium]